MAESKRQPRRFYVLRPFRRASIENEDGWGHNRSGVQIPQELFYEGMPGQGRFPSWKIETRWERRK